MSNILEMLFYGNLDPSSKTFERNSEYNKSVRTTADSEEKLLALLNDEEKALFMKIKEAQITINSYTSVEEFKCGFRLGVLLMTDVLANSGNLALS
ncbi:MAG: hypothetical protein FWF44_01780 [Defluviitaleaceae bacterium]|nr:hypothetical protein [Defluviitaleaceae bacterium]